MLNTFKKKELIRRPVNTKFFFKQSCKEAIETDIIEIEKTINNFITGKEIVSINHSLTPSIENSYIFIFFSVQFVDEVTIFQKLTTKISQGNFDLNEFIKSDNSGKKKKWFHF